MVEEIMRAGVYEWKSDFALKYIAEGKAVGKAVGKAEGKAQGKAVGKVEGGIELLLVVLEARGFVIDDRLRRRVTSCRDLEQIHAWARRAVTTSSLGEIFD
ncbi:hypothetical protein E1200_21800 [Actinomadura sp. GC306]|uniref:hypothetical protein n=1 Tax=Actinomadura sp. GC306 TaxID=2530367 RepID=UPI00104C5918|nr:hypothetical protein [Actinomadura sp. GC306]TDC63655.1 hypothetical protein E1200_21800 [Actinomadura sp. GC306]